MARARAHVIVSGLVQGVYFRDSTRRKARESGVTGWVRNRLDGCVEAVLEGERGDVERVVEWTRHGPPGAVVESVDVDWQEYRGEFGAFEIRW